MESIETVFSYIFGLVVRIGIPIAITALVIYLLRRLDARWRAEVVSAPRMVETGKPCWSVKGCSKEKRKACPAIKQTIEPCWQFFRSKDGVLLESCLGCDVFRYAPIPT